MDDDGNGTRTRTALHTHARNGVHAVKLLAGCKSGAAAATGSRQSDGKLQTECFGAQTATTWMGLAFTRRKGGERNAEQPRTLLMASIWVS